jgi:hypothetical protein
MIATVLMSQAASSGTHFEDRRDPRTQGPLVGGSRASDPPLTTRACADWMGFTTEWVRAAIDEGVGVGGRVVRLEAETLRLNGRRSHRIHLDAFITFLQAIGWKRIPRHPRAIASSQGLSHTN